MLVFRNYVIFYGDTCHIVVYSDELYLIDGMLFRVLFAYLLVYLWLECTVIAFYIFLSFTYLFTLSTFITDRISELGNAIASVCLTVRLSVSPLTFEVSDL